MATEKLNIDASQATASIMGLRKQLKDLKDQMAGLEEGSAEFLEVATAAGAVKHQLDEIQESVNGASADFGDMLSSATGALNGIVGGFTAAQGVMNLFGIESEAAVEAMKKLQALMAIGQGIAQIDNGIKAFNKFANAIKTTETYQKLFNDAELIGTRRTIENNTVTEKGTNIKKASAIATKALTTATKLLSGAMKAIGIGALIAAAGLLVEALKQLVSWFKNNFDESTKFAKKVEAVKLQVDAFKESLESHKAFDDFNNNITKMGWEVDDLERKIRNFNGTFKQMIEDQKTFEGEKTLDALIEWGDSLTDSEKTLKNVKDVLAQLNSGENFDYLIENLDNVEQRMNELFRLKKEEPVTIGDIIRATAMSDESVYLLEKKIQEVQNTIAKQKAIIADDNAARGLRREVERRLQANELQLEQLKTAAEANKDITQKSYEWAKAHNEEILTLLELEKQRKTNANEIYKIQIDTQANLNDEYKNSSAYILDQIKYYETLLSLQQQGSKEWVQTYNTIRTLTNNALPLLANTITTDVQPAVANLDKAMAVVGQAIPEHIANFREKVLLLSDDINKQISIIIDTMQRLSESSLGLSSNWTTAFGDVQVAMKSFINNIANSADAGAEQWAQSFALGAQAVGTILNTLSEEQDGNTKEGFETQKKYQIGATVLNTAAGIVNAWVSAMSPTNSYLTLPGQIALASTTTAALAALAGVQIAKIQKATFGGTADVSGSSVASTLIAPTQYSQAVQNANIESKLDDNRIVVSVEEINRVQKNVGVQVLENIY